MITVSIYRSALDDTKETQRIENSITIKDLYPDVHFTNSIISVNGILQDENYLLQNGDICTIRLFPNDSVGSAIGWVVGVVAAGLAMVGLSVAWPLAIIIAFTAGGLGAVAGNVIQNMLPKPDVPKSPESLEGIPQLRGAKNQSTNGQPVPLVLGKHLFTPGYVGRPYTQISGTDGEDQYFYALYLLGYGKLKVTDIKLGVIGDLASNHKNGTTIDNGPLVIDGDPFLMEGSPQLELIQSESESVIYPQAVVEEQLNIELSNVNEPDAIPLNVTRFTTKNPMKVQIEISLPGGLVKYNDEGKKKGTSVELSIRWRISRPDNSDDWKEFGQFGVRNPNQTGITYTITGNSLSLSNGAKNPTTTITRAKSKVMRFLAEKTFTNYSEVSDTDDTRVIELEIIRVNKQSDSSQVIDKVYLTAIRTWLFDNEQSKTSGVLMAQVPVIQKLRDKTARLGFSIKATQNTQGMLDALNCIVESKCRTWDSATKTWSAPDWDITNQQWAASLTETPSNNPASVALKLLQSPTLGRKAYPDFMLDMDSFGEFYEWCEEREYTCNGVLTQGKRTDEVLALILSTGRAMRILNGNKYGLLIDKPRNYPVMILNSQNVLEASNQKAFPDVLDGFLIKFVNEADGYQQTEIYVTADGTNKPGDDSVIETLELPYVTNRAQAIRIGWYLLACRRLRPEVWNRKLSVDGYLIGIGDLVEVQDDTIVVGIGEGAAITNIITDENGLVTEIQTDGQFDVSDMTKLYGIKIMQADGVHGIAVNTLQVNITEPGTYSNFTFEPAISPTFTIQPGNIVAFGEYEKITTSALCFGKKDNGDGTFDVTLIPYQEGIYTTDEGEIPPYEANITTPQAPHYPGGESDEIKKSDILDTIAESEIIVNSYVYSLILTNQSHVLSCDHDGNVLSGQLPFTTRAILFRGDTEVTLQSGITKYPGMGSFLFDPMLGDFVPAGNDITFSLVDPPEGITIDGNGLITVGESTVLESENYITVKATYNGRVCTTKLYIKKGGGVYTPKYLGVTDTPTGTQTVAITTSVGVLEVIAHEGDWVLYKGAATGIWNMGCMRWNGLQWEAMDESNNSSAYMDALADILADTTTTGSFKTAFIQNLFASTIYAEVINTIKMILNHPGFLQSANYTAGSAGFKLDSDGNAEFNNGSFRGHIEADSGTIGGVDIDANSLQVQGKGYLPIGFVYFQLKGQSEPQAIFVGVWENISPQYAGLFFRVEGGNAATFGQNQNMDIQSHKHTSVEPGNYTTLGNSGPSDYGSIWGIADRGRIDTSSTGGTETRPVNTTIRVWVRKS